MKLKLGRGAMLCHLLYNYYVIKCYFYMFKEYFIHFVDVQIAFPKSLHGMVWYINALKNQEVDLNW